MKPIRFTPHATDPALQATILGNLPEAALLEMMAAKAEDQNHGWLQTMLDGDLLGVGDDLQNFRMAQESGDHHGASLILMESIPQWSRRAIALTAFTQNVQIIKTFDASSTLMRLAEYGASQGMSTELKTLVAQGCTQVCKAYEAMSKDIGMAHAVNHHDSMQLAMTQWMVAACVMDLPESLEMLIKACPRALRTTVPLNKVSRSMVKVYEENVARRNADNSSYAQPQAEVTPFFVALQLSRLQCMEVIIPTLAKDVDANVFLGQQKGAGERAPVYLHSLDTLTGCLCTPKAFSRALTHSFDNATEFPSAPRDCTNKEKMFKAAIVAMENISRRQRPYVQSYVDAGILDRDPAQAILTACKTGHPDVIEHFRGRIPWNAIENIFASVHSPFYQAAHARDDDGHPSEYQEKAITRLLDLAIEDGQAENVFQTFAVSAGRSAKRIEPVSTMAENGWSSVIVKYLDNGLDPQAKVSGATLSLVEAISEDLPEMINVIHAHQVRKKAHALMRDLEQISNPASSGNTNAVFLRS